MKNSSSNRITGSLAHQTSWKMEQSKILIHWHLLTDTKQLQVHGLQQNQFDGFDMKATVYGAIDALNTGEMTADQYQKQLVDAWEKLLENVE